MIFLIHTCALVYCQFILNETCIEYPVAIEQIGMFKLHKEHISAYLERLQVFVKHSIAENKQISVLLSVVGPKTYALLRDFWHQLSHR